MKIIFLTVLTSMLFAGDIVSAPFAKWTKKELTLNNGVVQRTIKLPAEKGSFNTTSYKPVSGEYKYFLPASADFQFEVNGTVYSGNSNWSLAGIKQITDTRQGDGAAITL